MRLHEEYILRNRLDVPIVRYDKASRIILRSKDKPYNWRILSVSWMTGGYHPGHFELSCKEPVHNGYYKSRIIQNVEKTKLVFWDNYESTLLKIVENQKDKYLALSKKESLLASWSMFLYIYDAWLASNMPSEFHEQVSNSLDEEGISKLQSIRAARSYIMDRRVEEVYKYQIKPWSDIHSEWLEKLVNE